MARTNRPEPDIFDDPIQPEHNTPEHREKVVEFFEQVETSSRRRPASIPDAPSTRRNVSEGTFYRTRCNWPCPCGGTVPDAPKDCESRKFESKSGTYCTDAAICAFMCPDRIDCEAYATYQRLIKERHNQDFVANEQRERRFPEHEQKEPRKPREKREATPPTPEPTSSRRRVPE